MGPIAMADSRFLEDGRQRALKAAAEQIQEIERRIRTTVEAEYSGQLAVAGPLRRFWLRRRMAREIAARLREETDRIAPGDALYLDRP